MFGTSNNVNEGETGQGLLETCLARICRLVPDPMVVTVGRFPRHESRKRSVPLQKNEPCLINAYKPILHPSPAATLSWRRWLRDTTVLPPETAEEHKMFLSLSLSQSNADRYLAGYSDCIAKAETIHLPEIAACWRTIASQYKFLHEREMRLLNIGRA
jgi:hypothetical protein